ncbi:MAG: DUF2793 domain-containing protein [Burkholderiales bacterium]|nr:MAG: DUF2793 domain-containing protein [Burkholderiales bacterium]
MSNTSNLQLPYLAAGQAQKHITLNQSLRRLDAILQLSVASAMKTAQPASPTDGAVYIVPPGKSGASWAAFANWSLGDKSRWRVRSGHATRGMDRLCARYGPVDDS